MSSRKRLTVDELKEIAKYLKELRELFDEYIEDNIKEDTNNFFKIPMCFDKITTDFLKYVLPENISEEERKKIISSFTDGSLLASMMKRSLLFSPYLFKRGKRYVIFNLS